MRKAIELNSGGRMMLGQPQQKWWGDNPQIMQTAKFAGQELVAITDDAGAYQLMYLGFELGGFTSIERAKEAAPDFARRVLGRLAEMIAD